MLINILLLALIFISNTLQVHATEIIYDAKTEASQIDQKKSSQKKFNQAKLSPIYYQQSNVIEFLALQPSIKIIHPNKSFADFIITYLGKKLTIYLDNKLISALELNNIYIKSQIQQIIIKPINNTLALQLISKPQLRDKILTSNIDLILEYNKIDGNSFKAIINNYLTPLNSYGNKLTIGAEINFKRLTNDKLMIKSTDINNINTITDNLTIWTPSLGNDEQKVNSGNNNLSATMQADYSYIDIINFTNQMSYKLNQNKYYGTTNNITGFYPEITRNISLNNNLEIKLIDNNNLRWSTNIHSTISEQTSDTINSGTADSQLFAKKHLNRYSGSNIANIFAQKVNYYGNKYIINNLRDIRDQSLNHKLGSDLDIQLSHLNNILNNIKPEEIHKRSGTMALGMFKPKAIRRFTDSMNNNEAPKSQSQINSFVETKLNFNYSNDIKIYNNNNLQFGYNLTMHNNDSMVHKRRVIYRESNNVQSALTDRDKFIQYYNDDSINVTASFLSQTKHINKSLILSNANLMYSSGLYNSLTGGAFDLNNQSLARISNYSCRGNGVVVNSLCFSTASPIDYREQHKIYWNHQYQFNPNINAEYGISYQYAYRTNIINPFNQINGLDQKQYSNNNKTSYTPIIMSKLLKQNASNNLYYNQYNNKKEKIFDLINNNNHVDHLIDGYIQANAQNTFYNIINNISINLHHYNNLPTNKQLWLNNLVNNTTTLLPENVTRINFNNTLYSPDLNGWKFNNQINTAVKITRNAIAPVISKKAKPFLPLINKLNYLYAKMPYNKTKYTITDSIIKLEQEILQKFLDADDPLLLVNSLHIANADAPQTTFYYNIDFNVGYKNIIQAKYSLFGSNESYTSKINHNIIFNIQILPKLYATYNQVFNSSFVSLDGIEHKQGSIANAMINYNIDFLTEINLQLFFGFNNIFQQDKFNKYGALINNNSYLVGGFSISI